MVNGAFSYFPGSWSWNTNNGADWYTANLNLNANSYNPIYSDTINTVQPPALKVRVKTRYK